MKVLVIGSGGREHALARSFVLSGATVICAPGNPGIALIATCFNVKADNLDGLLQLAKDQAVGLTVVGPEIPLDLGIVDLFEEHGLKIFGPRKNAAIVEASKSFTKKLMLDNNIPTARAKFFESTSSLRDFLARLSNVDYPLVLKVDGLAAGKGVEVCRDKFAAEEFINRIESGEFKKAANRIIVEEFLRGEEASCIYVVDTKGNVLPLSSAQDHKPVFDHDEGPNTGGMGAYSPAPVVTSKVQEQVTEEIVIPFIKALKKEGRPFVGFLYPGLMIDDDKPSVVEINCRFGDPEAQPILLRLQSDLLYVIETALQGELDQIELEWDPRPAVCVVMAAENYPGPPKQGDEITGIKNVDDDCIVFHAGTALNANGELITAGGRILGVTAMGDTFQDAIDNAYDGVYRINFRGAHFRTDIGQRALIAR